jgi:hypothetical protein
MAQPRTLADELAALRDSENATAAVIREAEPDHTDILLIGRSFRGMSRRCAMFWPRTTSQPMAADMR